MILEALEHLDRRTAAGVLADAALSDAPAEGTAVSSDNYRAERDALRAELRKNLGLRAEDDSAKAKSAIDRALGQALVDLFMSKAELKSVIDGMGQAGEVPSSYYHAEFSRAFRNQFRPMGIDEDLIRRIIAKPDGTEHLWTDYGAANQTETLSLFLKSQPIKRLKNRHVCIVQTLRDGLVQHAQATWFVFDDVLAGLDDDVSPLSILSGFAAQYGLQFTIAGRGQGKFVHAIELPVISASDPLEVAMEVRRRILGEHFNTFSFRPSADGKTVRIGLAYAIDTIQYRKKLMDEGVIQR
jgi:hypothetical protein